MMLMSTLHAEVGKIDAEICSLSRARFSALARCDHITAKRLFEQTAALKKKRSELTDGQRAKLCCA